MKTAHGAQADDYRVRSVVRLTDIGFRRFVPDGTGGYDWFVICQNPEHAHTEFCTCNQRHATRLAVRKEKR